MGLLSAASIDANGITQWIDPHWLIQTFGVIGLFVILFAETGLLVGFFLPGDSLLVTAGIFCALPKSNTLHMNIVLVLIAGFLGAVLGGECGYYIGVKGGRPLFERAKNQKIHSALARAEEYFTKYGPGKAIFIARFIPIVRTVMNPAAGVLHVKARTFSLWNLIVGAVWALGITYLGYAVGSRVENIDRYILPIIAVIIFLSLIPIGIEVLRARHQSKTKANSDSFDGPGAAATATTIATAPQETAK